MKGFSSGFNYTLETLVAPKKKKKIRNLMIYNMFFGGYTYRSVPTSAIMFSFSIATLCCLFGHREVFITKLCFMGLNFSIHTSTRYASRELFKSKVSNIIEKNFGFVEKPNHMYWFKYLPIWEQIALHSKNREQER